MKVTQVYSLLNTVTREILGDSVVVNEDLSNVVDVGRAFQNVNGAIDNFVRALPDHIGRVVFADRVYKGRAPSVLMDGWEFGSVLEKIRMDLPEAAANESWELEDRASYDTNIFYKPKITAKFWNDRVTFEIPMSITERQVKSAFSGAQQMNSFMSLIYTTIDNAMTVKLDALIMRTINTAIGLTLAGEFPEGNYTNASGVRAVNLLYLYKQQGGEQALTPARAVTDPGFIRFASYTLKRYANRLGNMSTVFNAGGTSKFTPADRLKVVMLDDFKAAAEVYLYDAQGQLKDDALRLPEAEGVSFWQGSGLAYDFADVSAINVTLPEGATVNASGILAVMFDRDCLGVTNLDRRVRTHEVEKAEFWNQWHKMDAGYFVDMDENCVAFYVA